MASGVADIEGPFASFYIDSASTKLARRRLSDAALCAQSQEKRRSEALERQQQARLNATQQARRLVRESAKASGDDSQSESAQDISGDELAMQDSWVSSRHLMQPEWMVEVPANLASDWYVMPRPEGHRCLVTTSPAVTVCRQRSGLVHRFSSWLPGGSHATAGAHCILDCVLHEPNNTFYVLDVMCWKGYALYDCSAEFRLFWRTAKFEEERAAISRHESCGGGHGYRFEAVPAYRGDADGLRAAHSSPVPFERDGCYFLHKDGHYDVEGSTPTALLWKDPECSRYFIETSANGEVSCHQQAILQLGSDQAVCTGDDPPVSLGSFPEGLQAPRIGSLLKYTITSGTAFDNGLANVDLQYEGLANQRKGRADLYSKIVFQHLARTDPIMLSHLLEAPQNTEADMQQ